MTITGDTTTGRSRTGFLRRLRRRPVDPVVVTEEEALVRALCHDLGTPLASLHALLGHLAREGADADPVAELALAQADSLVSMLRTASATGEPCRPAAGRGPWSTSSGRACRPPGCPRARCGWTSSPPPRRSRWATPGCSGS
ncbi:hypothetical protein ACFQX8_09610 [Klenkia terrae]|uniref:hypothetical protein n=1 Tax=Klenkia terrae TaxID=1052259 RepID=UPI00361D690F